VFHFYPVVYPAAAAFAIVAGVIRDRRDTTTTFVMHVLTDVSTLAVAIALGA
jgi:hypothetical protein